MHREGPSTAAVFLLCSSLPLVAAPVAFAQARQGRALSSFQSRTAEFAREGAIARLRSPECQRILTDFKDGDGRLLSENLAPFALSPGEYLSRVPFLDGADHSLCRAGQSQLLTTQGVGRVFVCKGFLQTVERERAMAEVYLIHEMLHTLGLGENPPSSQEITQQVKRRCAP
jgi:hypothetical protein